MHSHLFLESAYMIKLSFDRKRDYFEEQVYPIMTCLYDKNTFLVVLIFASESAWSFLLLEIWINLKLSKLLCTIQNASI